MATFRYPELSGLYVLVTFGLFISCYSKISSDSFRKLVFFLVLILLLHFILIPFLGVYWRATAFLVYFALLILSFENIKPDLINHIKFINITYVIFLILSYFVYFDFINAGLRLEHITNQFEELYFESYIKTMIGFEGSTAGIDSYSMLVLLINILYYKKRPETLFMIVLSSINVIWATRLTPMTMVLVPLIYFILPISFRKIKNIVFINLFFISFLIPYILVQYYGVDKLFFALVTHARSDIWIEYIDYLRRSSFLNILFGFRSPLLEDSLLQYQPHSSYLRILFNYGILTYLFFIYYFYKKFSENTNSKSTFVVLAILTAAITNINILYNDNPIYLFAFLVFNNHTMQDSLESV